MERGFGAFEAWRDEMLEQEERDQHKLDRKIAPEEHWLRYGVSGRRKRNQRLADLMRCAQQRRDAARRRRASSRSRPRKATPPAPW